MGVVADDSWLRPEGYLWVRPLKERDRGNERESKENLKESQGERPLEGHRMGDRPR